jgi:hypothetical protein
MTSTSVYAMSSRWGLPIVWCLARATFTQPALNSKPAGSPPCDTHRSLGGANNAHLFRHRGGGVGTNPAPPDLSPLVLPPPLYTPSPPIPPPVPQRRRSPRLQSLLSSASAPTTAPPVCILPCPRQLKRQGVDA